MRETGSAALRRSLGAWPERVSSALAAVEVMRALRRARASAAVRRRAADVLDRIGLATIDEAVLAAAARRGPPDLRSLDAIHLATALSLAGDLGVFVTYDGRQARAAARAKLRVLSPA